MATFIKTCLICGKEYTANAYNTKWCKDCVTIGRKKRNADCRKRRKNAAIIRNKPYTNINDVLRQMEAYNKEHNTCLSYGQFIQIKNGGI